MDSIKDRLAGSLEERRGFTPRGIPRVTQCRDGVQIQGSLPVYLNGDEDLDCTRQYALGAREMHPKMHLSFLATFDEQ